MTTESQPTTEQRTFRVQTLGCKVNMADSEAIAAALVARGLAPAPADTPADVSVVNTCTVTHLGDRSSRQMLAQARRASPAGIVVATGCYAQVAPEAVAALPGVDVVIPNTDKEDLVNAVFTRTPTLLPMFPTAENPDDHLLAEILGKTRAQVKVQDGCDNRCTYCIVPTARGASRSRAIRDIVALARRKAAAGIQEIVLTGVHLGDFHPTPAEDLSTLLQALLDDTDIARIRVSSLEPEDFRLDWLALWANPRLCRHLHLPLQSGSDAVLRRMARRYTTARYREIAATAHAAIRDLALTTDIIVGFPGETEADAQRTHDFAAEVGFTKLHVFRYSPRAGTAAAHMHPQVPDAAKRDRSDALLALNDTLTHTFRQRHVGQMVEVLWEAPRPWGWEGLTDNYLRVELRGTDIPPGRDLRHTRTWTRVHANGDDAVFGALVGTETSAPAEVTQ